jgi:peptide/nickel transport system substrate-binding protein
MHKFRFRIPLFLVLVGFLVLGITAQAQVERGTLRIAHNTEFGADASLDPLSPNRFYEVNQLLYSRLIRVQSDGTLEPELATDWTASTDAITWTFNLRSDVTFHDGNPLSAADVVYTLQHALDPELNSPLLGVLGIIDTVEAQDEDTVTITLSQPFADFPTLLSDYRVRILPEGAAQSEESLGVGTGPFILESLDSVGMTTLVANENYWEGSPGVSRIELNYIPGSDAQIQAMLGGQIDMLQASSQTAALFSDATRFAVVSAPTGNITLLVMRTDTPPFDDVRVRRALRMVADRQEIIDLALGEGYGTVSCDTPVWPGDQYHYEGQCPQDIEGARALLAEAGYADGITLDLFTTDGFPGQYAVSEVYQQQAAEAGITINLVERPADTFWNDVWMVEPFVVTGWGQKPADQILNEVFRSNGVYNETFWNNAEFDALMDQARQTLDFETRRSLYIEAQQLIEADGGALIPYFSDIIYVVNTALQNFEPVVDFEIRWHELNISQ